MSLRRTDFKAQGGSLTGVIFDFENVGDELARHRHGFSDTHMSVVTSGKLLVRVTGHADMILEAGRVVDWPPDTEHSYEAIEAPARLVNILRPKAQP